MTHTMGGRSSAHSIVYLFCVIYKSSFIVPCVPQTKIDSKVCRCTLSFYFRDPGVRVIRFPLSKFEPSTQCVLFVCLFVFMTEGKPRFVDVLSSGVSSGSPEGVGLLHLVVE